MTQKTMNLTKFGLDFFQLFGKQQKQHSELVQENQSWRSFGQWYLNGTIGFRGAQIGEPGISI